MRLRGVAFSNASACILCRTGFLGASRSGGLESEGSVVLGAAVATRVGMPFSAALASSLASIGSSSTDWNAGRTFLAMLIETPPAPRPLREHFDCARLERFAPSRSSARRLQHPPCSRAQVGARSETFPGKQRALP